MAVRNPGLGVETWNLGHSRGMEIPIFHGEEQEVTGNGAGRWELGSEEPLSGKESQETKLPEVF